LSEFDIDLIKEIYRLRKEERDKHVREPDVYYVTDLVRCPLKREFELRYPEISLYEIMSPPTILGEFVHKGLQKLLTEIYGSDVEIEVEGEKKLSLPQGNVVRVKGRCDAIVKRDNKKIGIEIKSGRSDYGIPLEHHMDQARIYNWLFDLDETYLIYITYERVAQYKIKDKISEEELIIRITSNTYPRYVWECSYCPFSIICPYKKISK
jgi:CRISPR-associated exonuclease Cas4